MRSISLPPTLPLEYSYTPYYCEENIYLLADSFHRDDTITRVWDISVILVSNKTKTIALWDQKPSSDPAYPVIWDYHCILVLRPRLCSVSAGEDFAWVYDYDSRLAMPSRWSGEFSFDLPGPFAIHEHVLTLLVEHSGPSDYIRTTFKSDLCEMIPAQYRCNFRVVPATDYLDMFASDRSHMMRQPSLDGNTKYVAPPPEYPFIVGRKALGKGISNNLMQTFVEMPSPGQLLEAEQVGEVMNDLAFWKWGHGNCLFSDDKTTHVQVEVNEDQDMK